METKKIKGPTKADLKRKVMELNGQLACMYHFADGALDKASNLMGSGVMLQLTALGGKEIIPPVVILDGLSPETVEALRKDINRSYERATELKPRGCRI